MGENYLDEENELDDDDLSYEEIDQNNPPDTKLQEWMMALMMGT